MVFNKIHRNIKFNQKAWLKPYININIDLRKNAKNDFEKRFFSIMSNVFFGKTVENMKKIQKYQACYNQNKKELFSARTKLSYNNFFLKIYQPKK